MTLTLFSLLFRWPAMGHLTRTPTPQRRTRVENANNINANAPSIYIDHAITHSSGKEWDGSRFSTDSGHEHYLHQLCRRRAHTAHNFLLPRVLVRSLRFLAHIVASDILTASIPSTTKTRQARTSMIIMQLRSQDAPIYFLNRAVGVYE